MMVVRAIVVMGHLTLTSRNGDYLECAIDRPNKKNDQGDKRSADSLKLLFSRPVSSNHILHPEIIFCLGQYLVYCKKLQKC